jgi:glycosyltransferase involved in cell wall biosynthesis
MGFRLPIITTNVGGIPDVVTDGETGILIEPNSPEILASRLKSLLNDRDLRSHLGENGREFLNEHTIESQAETIHQAIKNHQKND